jgi:pimeloyl-ACP methyl ester carboxylesterase
MPNTKAPGRQVDRYLAGDGFRHCPALQDIAMPVYLWQGEVDNIVPPAQGQYLAQHIPQCQSKFYFAVAPILPNAAGEVQVETHMLSNCQYLSTFEIERSKENE